jgi:hypothetical protein
LIRPSCRRTRFGSASGTTTCSERSRVGPGLRSRRINGIMSSRKLSTTRCSVVRRHSRVWSCAKMLVSAAVNHANSPSPRIVAIAPISRAPEVLSASALKFPVANVFISQNESLSVRSRVFESCSSNHTA